MQVLAIYRGDACTRCVQVDQSYLLAAPLVFISSFIVIASVVSYLYTSFALAGYSFLQYTPCFKKPSKIVFVITLLNFQGDRIM